MVGVAPHLRATLRRWQRHPGEQGQLLAGWGKRMATVPHLHFALFENGAYLNPPSSSLAARRAIVGSASRRRARGAHQHSRHPGELHTRSQHRTVAFSAGPARLQGAVVPALASSSCPMSYSLPAAAARVWSPRRRCLSRKHPAILRARRGVGVATSSWPTRHARRHLVVLHYPRWSARPTQRPVSSRTLASCVAATPATFTHDGTFPLSRPGMSPDARDGWRLPTHTLQHPIKQEEPGSLKRWSIPAPLRGGGSRPARRPARRPSCCDSRLRSRAIATGHQHRESLFSSCGPSRYVGRLLAARTRVAIPRVDAWSCDRGVRCGRDRVGIEVHVWTIMTRQRSPACFALASRVVRSPGLIVAALAARRADLGAAAFNAAAPPCAACWRQADRFERTRFSRYPPAARACLLKRIGRRHSR